MTRLTQTKITCKRLSRFVLAAGERVSQLCCASCYIHVLEFDALDKVEHFYFVAFPACKYAV